MKRAFSLFSIFILCISFNSLWAKCSSWGDDAPHICEASASVCETAKESAKKLCTNEGGTVSETKEECIPD